MKRLFWNHFIVIFLFVIGCYSSLTLVAQVNIQNNRTTADKNELVGMDPNLIRQTLLRHLEEFKKCYQSTLDLSKTPLSGVVILNFRITPSGRVSSAKVKAKKGNLPYVVKSCVENVVRNIIFPAYSRELEIAQPMNFIALQKKGASGKMLFIETVKTSTKVLYLSK